MYIINKMIRIVNIEVQGAHHTRAGRRHHCYDAMYSARYQYPEYLSATDSHVVAQRRLITEHARGLKRAVQVAEMTTAVHLVPRATLCQGCHRTAGRS